MAERKRPTITRWVTCDSCGTDASDEQGSDPAYPVARAEGFERLEDGRWLCAGCLDPLAPVNVPTTTENRTLGC